MKGQFTLHSWKGLLAGAALAVVIGVVMGSIVNLRPMSNDGGNVFSLDEVILGTPVTPPMAGEPWDPTDRMTQQRTYATVDPLALRVVSQEPAEARINLSVRLLREDGSVQALSPSVIVVSGGTGGYCCWRIEPPGKYKLQIFRDAEAPYVLPVTIVAARQNASPIRLQ